MDTKGQQDPKAQIGIHNSLFPRMTSDLIRSSDSSESEDELDLGKEEEMNDSMIGALRRGLRVIRSNARETLRQCDTDESRKDTQDKLETCTLNLIKKEKVVMQTASIVAQIVDTIVPDDDDNHIDSGKPLLFAPVMAHMDEIAPKAELMSLMLAEKLKIFEDSLEDEEIKQDPKFTALQREINLASSDVNKSQEISKAVGGQGDGQQVCTSIDIDYGPEEEFDDDSVIPRLDPLTREPMMNPLKNKYCHHIFERESIYEYMRTHCNAKCPLQGCINPNYLAHDHFIYDPKLTEQIQRVNTQW